MSFDGHDGIREKYEEALPHVYDIWKGKYENLKDLPKCPAEFIPGYKIFWLGSQLVHSEIPEFGANFKYTEKCFENWFQGSILTMEKGFEVSCSAEGCKLILVYDAGILCFQDFTIQILNIRLSEKIRDSGLFPSYTQCLRIGNGAD